MITLIAAIGSNNEIGFNNQLLWNIPEDMKHFKEYTMGKVVIMGSNTFSSIKSKGLPGRKCIVISSKYLQCNFAICAKSLESAMSIEHNYPELVVIGGASIYKQTIDISDKLVITHIETSCEADTFFPQIDLTQWEISNIIDCPDDNLKCSIIEYIRVDK
jgi:dihydrofolate reductase